MAEERELRKITQEELNAILIEHEKWLESDEKEGKQADLSYTDLSESSLPDAFNPHRQLSKAHFERADLSGAHLKEANLEAAYMEGAILRDAHLEWAILADANLDNAFLAFSHMESARLSFAYLKKANFSGANLHDANLVGAHMQESILNQAHMEGVILKQANLEGAEICGTYLEGANIRFVNLKRAFLQYAHLKEADLEGTYLNGADIEGADFRNTNLTGVQCDRRIRCRGVRLDGCYGSPSFDRYLRDQEYVEEFRSRYPISHFFWWVLADCGRSTLRWTGWSLGLVTLFAVIYGWLGPEHFKLPVETRLVDGKALEVVTGLAWGPLACLYYSVVTFSTLGFGDITPRSDWAAFFVMLEVIVGYIMLGGMITLLSNKLARRS